METRIFIVCEIEWPSCHTAGHAHGVFSNFEAAESYVKDTYTPMYDRHMLIIEQTMTDTWPHPKDEPLAKENILTYYCQYSGAVHRDFITS